MSGKMDQKTRLNLFNTLLRIRLTEQRIAKNYSQQKMRCPVHLSVGQEAVAVGVCSQLLDSDYLISTHRAHAHFLAKGGDLKSLISEICGKSSGCSRGRGGSMHLIDLNKGILGTTPIVGGSMPIAVGAAFKVALKNENRLVVLFFGEGSTEEGVWAECLNFASLKKLPILFICENNFFSVYSPLEVRQSQERDRVKIAEAHGLFSKKENGNDLEKVVELAKAGIDHIKQGLGPVYLEFDTYRHLEHCGPNEDDHLNYRDPEITNFWKNNCPLNIYQKKLLNLNLLNSSLIEEMKDKINKELDEAFDSVDRESMPVFKEAEEEIYAK